MIPVSVPAALEVSNDAVPLGDVEIVLVPVGEGVSLGVITSVLVGLVYVPLGDVDPGL